MISAQKMDFVRELKSVAFGVVGLVRNSLSWSRCSKRRSANTKHVVLLSLGGRLGSPFLAKVLRDRGYVIHVISGRFPGYELVHADYWHKADCLNEYHSVQVFFRKLEMFWCQLRRIY